MHIFNYNMKLTIFLILGVASLRLSLANLFEKKVLQAKTDKEIIHESKKDTLFIGDMMFLKSDTNTRTARATSQTWPLNTVPYVVSDNVTRELRPVITNAINYFHRYTCIRFRTVIASDTYWIRFLQDPDPSPNKLCASYVGFLNRRDQGVFLGQRCKFGSMVHELLHALGFEHEHNRNDRAKFIRIVDNNIDTNAKSQYRLECKDNSPQCTYNDYGVTYNYESIMHYCPYCGSNGNGPCFVVLNNTNAMGDPRKVGQRDGFSRGDWLMTNRRYSCPINENQAPPPLADYPEMQDIDDIGNEPTDPPGIDELTEATTEVETTSTIKSTTIKATTKAPSKGTTAKPPYCAAMPFSPGCLLEN